MDIGLDSRRAYDEGFADGLETARRELLAEIEKELEEAHAYNSQRLHEYLQKANTYDDHCEYIDGKRAAIRGIIGFIEELREKYGVTDDGTE